MEQAFCLDQAHKEAAFLTVTTGEFAVRRVFGESENLWKDK